MQTEQPLKPANIANIVATNQGHLPLTMETPQAKALSVEDVAKGMMAGAVAVDVRNSAEFGAGHIPNSFNIQLASSEFEQRVGWIVPQDARIILVANSSTDAQAALFKMAFLALDTQVVGYLKGGIVAWMHAGRSLATVPQLDVHSLHQRLNNGQPLHMLDVREDSEWDEGHIEGAHWMPYRQMAQAFTATPTMVLPNLERDVPIAVACAGGFRSSTAISVLKRHGYQSLFNVTGGMGAWKNAKLPMVAGDGETSRQGERE